MRRLLVWLAALTYATALNAVDIQALEVRHESEVYYVMMRFSVNAALNRVRGVIMDYAHLPALRSRATRVHTRMQGCVWFLCKDIACVEDFSEDGAGDLNAVFVPAMSDLKSGRARWRFRPQGKATRVSFTARMAPDFWIPPLIGPLVLKHWLHAQLIETAGNLERLARPAP